MKKRILLIMLLAVMLSVLCSCGCSHEWTEATCTTPKTCEKCAETEGEALGHSFADATCDAPKTCTLCGVTEGEALGHRWLAASCTAPETCEVCGATQGDVMAHAFGKWTISGEEMTHACQMCQFSEAQPLDREVYFYDIMVGHWDLLAEFYNGSIPIPAYYLEDNIGTYIHVAEDGSVYMLNGDRSYNITCAFGEYIADDDGSDVYSFTFLDEAKEPLIGGVLIDDAGEISMGLYAGEHLIILHKPYQLADYIESTWSCYEDEQLYSLVLNGDRTFTGNFDGEVSGTWHLTSLRDDGGYAVFTVKFRYMKDEVPIVATGEMNLGITMEEVEEYQVLQGEPYTSLYLYTSEYGYHFTYKFDVDASDLMNIMEEGKTRILGDWTSVEVSTYHYVSGEEETGISDTSCHAAFHEDGTFTLFLDEEITGTWQLEDWGMGRVMRYIYTLQAVNGEQYICEVSYEQPHTLFITKPQDESTMTYSFVLATE